MDGAGDTSWQLFNNNYGITQKEKAGVDFIYNPPNCDSDTYLPIMSTKQPKSNVRQNFPRFEPMILSNAEANWRDHQKWLRGCGYMLRPRFVPGWKPSWIDENGKEIESWTSCEDSRPLKVSLSSGSLLYTMLTYTLAAQCNMWCDASVWWLLCDPQSHQPFGASIRGCYRHLLVIRATRIWSA